MWLRTTRKLCIVALGVGTPSLASAQQSVSIALHGYVPEVSTLQILEINSVVSQDLRTGITERLVARFAEQSNSLSGYTIKISSDSAKRDNYSGLVNRQNGSIVPYSLSYGGVKLQFANGEATLNRTPRRQAERRQENELKISTGGADQLPKGEYSDTLTLVIAAR